MPDEFDTANEIEALEAKGTSHNLPIGWLVLFIGLILWAAVYIASYTPVVSGWTQAGAYEKTVK